MGRYNCIPLVTGTIQDFCIYKRGGRYYFRGRSSLTAERVKNDPAFAKTRHFAALLAQASRIGSAVYATIPADQKKHTMYRRFTGEAMTWLKIGWTEQEVLNWLLKRYDKRAVLTLYSKREKPLTGKEQAARQITLLNRRLLKAIRRVEEDHEYDAIFEHVPQNWQKMVEKMYSG